MLQKRVYIWSIALMLTACGNKPPPSATTPASAASLTPNSAVVPPLEMESDETRATGGGDATPATALGLGNPIEELPPLAPRPIERQPLDLTHLDEAPILEVDALGHTSKVRSLSFSHDGRYLISAGYDKTVRVWSSSTGELVRTIRGEIGPGPAGRIYATSLSQNDELLAVGGWLGKYDGRVSSSSREDAYKIRILDFLYW